MENTQKHIVKTTNINAMFTPPNWVSALPESSVLKEIIEQRCVSASQLGLLPKLDGLNAVIAKKKPQYHSK